MTTRNSASASASNNTLLWILLGIVGVGGTIGAVSYLRSRKQGKALGEATNGGPGSSKTGETPPLAEIAATLRGELLLLEGCTVSWRTREVSQTRLLARDRDFFIPAIADARAKGFHTIDEISMHIAALLVPGCPWPPAILESFDLDDAIAGELPATQHHLWVVAQGIGAVQVYLTIRHVVSKLTRTTKPS